MINMNDKKSAEILISLMKKYSFSDEEKEALSSAIGVLSWTSLAESRTRAKRERIEKSGKW